MKKDTEAAEAATKKLNEEVQALKQSLKEKEAKLATAKRKAEEVRLSGCRVFLSGLKAVLSLLSKTLKGRCFSLWLKIPCPGACIPVRQNEWIRSVSSHRLIRFSRGTLEAYIESCVMT